MYRRMPHPPDSPYHVCLGFLGLWPHPQLNMADLKQQVGQLPCQLGMFCGPPHVLTATQEANLSMECKLVNGTM